MQSHFPLWRPCCMSYHSSKNEVVPDAFRSRTNDLTPSKSLSENAPQVIPAKLVVKHKPFDHISQSKKKHRSEYLAKIQRQRDDCRTSGRFNSILQRQFIDSSTTWKEGKALSAQEHGIEYEEVPWEVFDTQNAHLETVNMLDVCEMQAMQDLDFLIEQNDKISNPSAEHASPTTSKYCAESRDEAESSGIRDLSSSKAAELPNGDRKFDCTKRTPTACDDMDISS